MRPAARWRSKVEGLILRKLAASLRVRISETSIASRVGNSASAHSSFGRMLVSSLGVPVIQRHAKGRWRSGSCGPDRKVEGINLAGRNCPRTEHSEKVLTVACCY